MKIFQNGNACACDNRLAIINCFIAEFYLSALCQLGLTAIIERDNPTRPITLRTLYCNVEST